MLKLLQEIPVECECKAGSDADDNKEEFYNGDPRPLYLSGQLSVGSTTLNSCPEFSV